MTGKRRVLLSGASGYLGSLATQSLATRFNWLLTDLQPSGTNCQLPFVAADITDLDALRRLCKGIDTVVHLAADSHEQAPWESVRRNNLVGTYNIFEAAAEAGCRRIIFASSIQVTEAYSDSAAPVSPDQAVRPLTLYAASKVWGEALAHSYQSRLSVLCLRIGWVKSAHDLRLTPGWPHLDKVITEGDTIRLLAAAIEAPDTLRWGIFHGLSNNRRQRMDITSTMELLNYRPQDDAFALARAKRPSWLRRWAGRFAKQSARPDRI